MSEYGYGNKRLLDIVVPHYKEPWEIGAPLFKMLAIQRGIDFRQIRVIVVNDGAENELDAELFSEFPYETVQISIPHAGISAARNAGLDYSDAEWINFCDFDDTYSNVYALRDVLEQLQRKDFDMLWVKMIVENFVGGANMLFISPERTNFVFTHGKFYRRSYLKEIGVRFDSELEYNEDSLFNAQIIALLDYHRIGEIRCMTPPYIWCRRENSVTSREGAKDPATYGHFLRNCKITQFYLDNHLERDRISDMVVRVIYDTYYMLCSTNISKVMNRKILGEFKVYLQKFGSYWRRPDIDTLNKIKWLAEYELGEAEKPLDKRFKTVEKWMTLHCGYKKDIQKEET